MAVGAAQASVSRFRELTGQNAGGKVERVGGY